MILSSTLLVAVSCMTLAMGVRDSSMRVVFISIGCGIVSGAVLIASIKGRTEGAHGRPAGTADGYVPVVSDPLRPSTRPAHTVTFTGTVPLGEPAWRQPPDPGQAAARGSLPPTVAPDSAPLRAPSPEEPPLDLQAPGPGFIGRLRRPQLMGGAGPGPPVSSPPEDVRPSARRSSGEACASTRQPRAATPPASAVPRKSGERSRTEAGAKSRVPPGASAARSRATGTPAAGNGTVPARQARPPTKAGKR